MVIDKYPLPQGSNSSEVIDKHMLPQASGEVMLGHGAQADLRMATTYLYFSIQNCIFLLACQMQHRHSLSDRRFVLGSQLSTRGSNHPEI